jgi:uncharacterized protein (TIGR03437 family)
MKPFRIACGLLLLAGTGRAQQYVISTIAGGGPPSTPAAGPTVSIGPPSGVATDSAGNAYFLSLNCLFKLDPNGGLTRVAGNSRPGYSGDGGPATNAQLANPLGVAVDASGNLFIADTNNSRIRRISPSGIITTVAGNGIIGFSGDGGPATSAQLANPTGVAVDGAGNLFIADTNYNLFPAANNRIRKVSPDGLIITVAGNGASGFSGDGGPATSAQLASPAGVAVDGSGSLFIVDFQNWRVRKVSANGIITTVAGNGTIGSSGDGGPATGAQLSLPQGVAVDGSGNLFIADNGNSRVRKVSTNGIITTVAGTGFQGFSGDGGAATSAHLINPTGVAVDGSGNLFIADSYNNRIRKVSTNGIITTVAGNGTMGFSGDGGPATSASLASPNAVAVDGSGNLFIADYNNNRVRKVSTTGIITTVAGNGTAGFSGDGGPATGAQIWGPDGVAVDASGNIFIADFNNKRIRKVAANGIITTVAGTGTPGFSGDGGPATSASMAGPYGVAVDGQGNLFISDFANGRVRKVSSKGIITTVAGGGRPSSCCGDNGPATSAALGGPVAVAVDGSGNLFIADPILGRVRKVSTDGIITTVAGTEIGGFSGDGGPATSASLNPDGIAVDGSGNLFITTSSFNRVRRVSADGIITTVAGNGVGGFSGDGGLATSAQLYLPITIGLNKFGIATDGSGNVFIADSGNNAIRLLTPANQSVLITAVVDAASESAVPVSPGKIVVVYGAGLGLSQGATASPANGAFGTQLSGTTVSFNGVAAPIYYASATQVNAIVPYSISGGAVNVTVAYQGQTSSAFSVDVAPSSPSLFTSNSTGAGQAASLNAVDGTLNSAANPVKIGAYISLYATGEGQTTPTGVDGKLATVPLPSPTLPVTATVDGIPALVQYKGGVFGTVAGLMQVNVQIPAGVKPGGYVPVVLQVGDASTVNGAVWIAVSAN